jgi:hypothetical protein
MRFSLVPLLVLLVAGCGNNNGGGEAMKDGGVGGVGPITNPTDLAMAHTADMAMSLSNCYQLVTCLSQATDPAGQLACFNMATKTAQNLALAFNKCADNACGTAGADAGTGPCDSQDQCYACIGTGKSPTGVALGNCMNMQNGPTVTDPKCGLCVDAEVACFKDGQ